MLWGTGFFLFVLVAYGWITNETGKFNFQKTNNPNFPASIDYGNPDIHGEIHTNDAFQGYMKNANPDKTVVFSIIIFGDGTVVDGAMRKSIEPYSFTLGIFWQHAHAKPSTWHIFMLFEEKYAVFIFPRKK